MLRHSEEVYHTDVCLHLFMSLGPIFGQHKRSVFNYYLCFVDGASSVLSTPAYCSTPIQTPQQQV